MEFETWMAKVDRWLEGHVGFNSNDLADIGYWDLWHNGATPREAAEEALANEGIDIDNLYGTEE